MVDLIAREGFGDSVTLAAMREVPRHLFVPERYTDLGYADLPLPIGHDATISQPSVVAIMTAAIAPRPGMRVLEIGTGSGYQAAVLAQIGCQVYTIEIVSALAAEARRRLDRLGYGRVAVRHGDGYQGWPEAAPFDGIVVTAAPEEVPPALVAQLAPGGRMAVPVGGAEHVQRLLLVQKDSLGRVRTRELAPVRFVPMIRPER